MLSRVSRDPYESREGGAGGFVTIDLPAILAFFRRRFLIIGVTVVACVVLGMAYLAITPKQYTATAQLLIDTRKVDLFRQQAVIEDGAINTSAVESQSQILQSEGVAKAVIRNPDLNLLGTAEFGRADPSVWDLVKARWTKLFSGAAAPSVGAEGVVETEEPVARPPEAGGQVQQGGSWYASLLPAWAGGMPPAPPSKDEMLQRAVQKFGNQLDVKRLGLSYVIEIKFTSVSAGRAAKIANTLASAYIDDQLQSKLDAAERASKWLQNRITELRQQASTTDSAVQTFKANNNFLNAGDQLITDQQVQELSKQRILAETNVAEAKARYDRIRTVNSSDNPDASVTDTLGNAVFVRLQQQYFDVVRQRNELAARYSDSNRAVTAMDETIAGLRRDLRSELKRLEETYKSDYEIAQTRLNQMQESLDKLLGNSAKSLQAQVQLRELESTSNSYSTLYNSFLERYVQTVQQQSFPVSEAKLITPATKPLKSSAPKRSLVLAAAVALGGLLGCGFAAARELLDRVVRTSAQLEALTGTEVLGVLPLVKRKPGRKEQASNAVVASGFAPYLPSRARIVLDAPFSLYAETIRSIKVATDVSKLQHETKVIGVVSAMPSEGKTTVVSNLAFLTAQTSARTLLIDADLRNPSLTRMLAPHSNGLLQLLKNEGRFEELVKIHPELGLYFLPSGVQQKISNTSELLRSEEMGWLLTFARKHFDYIMVDLPPLLPVVDARASAHFFDGYVYVAEWGKTSSDVIRRALSGARNIDHKLIGAVLNKADLQVLSRFEDVKNSFYTSYYHDDAPAPKQVERQPQPETTV